MKKKGIAKISHAWIVDPKNRPELLLGLIEQLSRDGNYSHIKVFLNGISMQSRRHCAEIFTHFTKLRIDVDSDGDLSFNFRKGMHRMESKTIELKEILKKGQSITKVAGIASGKRDTDGEEKSKNSKYDRLKKYISSYIGDGGCDDVLKALNELQKEKDAKSYIGKGPAIAEGADYLYTWSSGRRGGGFRGSAKNYRDDLKKK